MPGPDSDAILPEDSLADPELGFGEPELTMEPMAPMAAEPERPSVRDVSVKLPEPEPVTLSQDADVPLDVEPDADAALSDSDIEFGADLESEDAPAAPPPRPQDDRLRVELSSSRGELETLRDSVAALRARNNELEATLQQSTPVGEISRMSAQLAQSRAHHQQAEEQLRKTQQELAAALEQAQAQPATEASPPGQAQQRDYDVMEAQLVALQAENTQLKEALREAQGAESRTEHAHDALQRRVNELEQENAGLRQDLLSARRAIDLKVNELEQLGNDLARARKELADRGDEATQVKDQLEVLDAQKSELVAAQNALAEARAEIARLTEASREASRVPALEDKLSALQEQVVAKEKDIAEAQEKLDTEAARSYRLSQRRIPALNKEIEDAQETNRDLERKLQKAELRAQTLDDQATELKNRIADLERALGAAKARAQDTQVIAPADVDARNLADDELRRTSNKLREVEAERARLAETLRRLGEAHGTELSRHISRGEKLEKESEERFESLLGQRTQMRVLRERVVNMLQVAEDLAGAKDGQRKVLLDALRKMAELPPEKN
ncbi:MAG: hypothetical protein IPP14_07075 [Planctomycetes bacterium]|nr:hypothetical protein [Planctomycetota bacterium]